MVSEHLNLKYWTVNHTYVIYVTFSFCRSFVINTHTRNPMCHERFCDSSMNSINQSIKIESWVLQIKKKNFEYNHHILEANKIELPHTANHIHMQMIISWVHLCSW